jgi:hypothetical protein
MGLHIKLQNSSIYSLVEIEEKLKEFIVPQIADEDIIVVKRLRKIVADNNVSFCAVNQSHFIYKIGEIHKEPNFFEGDIKNMAQMFHSRFNNPQKNMKKVFGNYGPFEYLFEEFMNRMFASSPKPVLDDLIKNSIESFEINYGFHSWSIIADNYLHTNECYCKFIIPKGTKYFVGDYEHGKNILHYVSEQIIFDSILQEDKEQINETACTFTVNDYYKTL